MYELNELLRKQYRQYRNRISYIGWHLHWHDCQLYPLIVFGGRQ